MIFYQTIKCAFVNDKPMPERCVMTTQSLPAASLRTANCLPAARVLLRVATYLIYKALWSIKRAIPGVESFFLPASPVRQGNPEARLPAAVVAYAGWNSALSCRPVRRAGAEKPQQHLLDDDPWWGAARGIGTGDLVPNPRRHAAEDERVRVVGLGKSDWRSAVGGLADPDVERHLAEKLGAEPLGLVAGAAMAENIAPAAAMRA